MKEVKCFALMLVILFSFVGCAPEEKPQEEVKQIEYYCKEFFAKNKEIKDDSDLIIRRTKEFMAINSGTKEFSAKKPFKIFPIYAYGIEGVAYYEIWLTKDGKIPEGWLLLSATEKDYPLVNFSHEGTPYSQKVLIKADELGVDVRLSDRIYRFGVSYFTLENQEGKLLADYGSMPHWLPTDVELSGGGKGDSKTRLFEIESPDLEPIKDIHFKPIENYDSLRIYFPKSYFTAKRAKQAQEMQRRIFPKQGHGEAYRKVHNPHYIYRWIEDYYNQCLYTQILANSGYNWPGCKSGCNNNAWTSLYGWWDKNMGKTNLIPTTSTGEGCPTYRNTRERRVVVDPVQMWFRGICRTYCGGNTGWTKWSKAWYGYKWTQYQGYGYSYWYRWSNSDGGHVDLANILVDCIGNNLRPAHVGANSHFWVGTGLAQWTTETDWTWVYCYPGWKQNHDDDVWIWWHDLNSSTKVFVY